MMKHICDRCGDTIPQGPMNSPAFDVAFSKQAPASTCFDFDKRFDVCMYCYNAIMAYAQQSPTRQV